MALRVWGNPEFNLELARQVESYRARIQQLSASTSVEQALTLADYADLHPRMNPDVAVALASGGVDPRSDAAFEQAYRSARAQTFAPRLGEIVRAPEGPVEPAPRPEGQTVEGPSMGELPLWQRPGRALSNTFGALGRGTMMGFGALGQETSALVSSVGEALLDDEKGFWEDAVDNFKNNAARSELAMAFAELNRRVQTDGFDPVEDLWEGSEDFIGTGFLPGGQIAERRERDKERLKLDGQFVTPGRLVARHITHPGSEKYNLVSGLADAFFQVVLDPVNYLIPGAAAGGLIAKAVRNPEIARGITGRAVRAVGPQGQAALRRIPGMVSIEERQGLGNIEQVRNFIGDVEKILVNGREQGVVGRAALDLIDGSDTARQLVRWVAQEQSPGRLIDLSKGTIPPEAAVALAGMRDPDEIATYLRKRVLGPQTNRIYVPRRVDRTPEEAFQDPNVGARFRDRTFNIPGMKRQLHGIRVLGDMPSRFFTNPEDVGSTYTNLVNTARNAKLPEETWRAISDEYLRKATGPLADDKMKIQYINKASDRLVSEIGKELASRGVDEATVQKLTRRISNSNNYERRAYGVDEIGREFPSWGSRQLDLGPNHEPAVIPSPITLAQMAQHAYPLPDPLAIRRNISAFSKITSTTGWELTNTGLRVLSAGVWAPFIILRGALTIRSLADEQGRMAASGLDNVFTHPIRAISWMLGAGSDSLKRLPDWASPEGTGPSRAAMEVLDAWAAAKSTSRQQFLGSDTAIPAPVREVGGYGTRPYHKSDPDSQAVWVQTLANAANDLQMVLVARMGPAGYADWLLSDDGKVVLAQLNDSIFAHKPLRTRSDVLAHAHDIENPLRVMTGGSTELRQAIAEHRVGRVDVKGQPYDSRDVYRALQQDGLDKYQPQVVVGLEDAGAVVDVDSRWKLIKKWDQMLDTLFGWTLAKPSDAMSRSPSFRQYMTQRYREGAAYMDPAKRAELEDAAYQLDIDISDVKFNGNAAFDEVGDLELMAADYAADRVKGLLYDAHKRTQYGDMMRIIFPFLDPWADSIKTWGGAIKHNPIVLQRGREIADAASDTDGFFAENDYGESEFVFPVASWLFNAIAGGEGGVSAVTGALRGEEGANVQAVGRTLGLNIMGTGIMPGVGPVVSLPMAVLLPEKPEGGWLEEQLFPFGRPETAGEMAESLLPAYMRRGMNAIPFFTSPESDRQFANTVSDVMRVLMAEGDYLDEHGGLSRDAQQRLLKDATTRARLLYAVSAVSTFFTPTPTNFRFTAETPDGALTFNAIQREYDKLQQEDYRTATERFIERFGTNLAPLMQDRSYSTGIRSTGQNAVAWEMQNRHLEEFAPNLFGVFAPVFDDDDLNPSAFARQFMDGSRENYAPDDFLWAYNNIVGRSLYYTEKERLGDAAATDEGRAYLATLQDGLQRAYPGYNSLEAVKKTIPVEEQIAELQRAVTESQELANTPAGRGIAEYLALRNAAMDVGIAVGGGPNYWQSSNSDEMIALRSRLRQAAEDIIRRNPEFAVAYDRVFDREFPDDDPVPVERRTTQPQWLQQEVSRG